MTSRTWTIHTILSALSQASGEWSSDAEILTEIPDRKLDYARSELEGLPYWGLAARRIFNGEIQFAATAECVRLTRFLDGQVEIGETTNFDLIPVYALRRIASTCLPAAFTEAEQDSLSKIRHALAESPSVTVEALQETTALSESAISHALSVLKRGGEIRKGDQEPDAYTLTMIGRREHHSASASNDDPLNKSG